MKWAPLLLAATLITPARAEPWPSFDGPAEERDRLGWAVPDYARLQSGGYLGMGTVAVGWWDYNANRLRLAVGYVGENGIKPNTFYRADERGQLVEVKG